MFGNANLPHPPLPGFTEEGKAAGEPQDRNVEHLACSVALECNALSEYEQRDTLAEVGTVGLSMREGRLVL